MKIKTFTTKKNVGQRNSTSSSKRDPFGSFMSRCCKLFLLLVVMMGYAVNPAEAQNDTILVDFGNVAGEPANWNSINTNIANAVFSLKNSRQEATSVSMKFNGPTFTNSNNAGTTTPHISTGFPGTVTQDNWYSGPTISPKYEISGLDPAKDYTFIMFSSRTPGDATDRTGKWTFAGSTTSFCTLNATGNTSNIASATAKPRADGTMTFTISSNSGGNVHTNAMKIVYSNSVACTTSFTGGALTVCQDAANETYTATTTNSSPVVYSVLPVEAGVIDPATGVMDWDAAFVGTATITATADESCGTTTATMVVTVNAATGVPVFTAGAETVCQNADDETYTATAANSTSIVYSVLPAEAGVINSSTGVMNWDVAFIGTATITATAEGSCGTKTDDREVTVNATTGIPVFTAGAETVCQDAADGTYTATTTSSSPVVYSVLPVEAGVIDSETGVMNWDAAFVGTATIKATAEGSCGTTSTDRVVTVSATGVPVFTAGAETVFHDADDETYTATAANSTSVAYSVLPVEAGVIDSETGIMNWDAAFVGTATITATAEGSCGTTTADRVVTVSIEPEVAPYDTIQINFGASTVIPKWNSLSSVTVNALPKLLANTKEEATTVGIRVSGAFNAANTAGTNNPDPSIGFPGTVTSSNFYASRTSYAALEINGLDPEKEYSFIVFSSIMKSDADVREGKFLFIGSVKDSCLLNATNNTSNVASAKVKPNAAGIITVKCTTGPNNTNGGGNFHLSDMKIIYDNTITCKTTFTTGAETVCQDAADETYTATSTNSTSIAYSVLPIEAGEIDPATGVMNWDAAFVGTATITASAEGLCGTTTADRVVTVNAATGVPVFTAGAETVFQDAADETYTATAVNSTSIVYSALPIEAGVIDPATGVMNWDAAFVGTATITATAEGLCGTTTADRVVTVSIEPVEAPYDTIQIDFGVNTSATNWVPFNSNTANFTASNMINSNGVGTGVNLMLTRTFGGNKADGTANPAPPKGFPLSVSEDYFYVGNGGYATFEISGLDDTKDYTFIIFASRMPIDNSANGPRVGKYEFTGATTGVCTLDANGNQSNLASATAKPLDGKIIFKVSQNVVPGGNAHLNAMKIIYDNSITCKTTFTAGAETVCQDAADETYTATTTNSAPVVYSVLPAEAGVIDPATGVMNWDAAFVGTATITATADESCGTTTATRVVTVNAATGVPVFTAGAESLDQDVADETYTATAANSTSIVYSVLPAEAGVIDPVTGVMNWDAAFVGTATITATAEGLCSSTTADRVVTVKKNTGLTQDKTNLINVFPNPAKSFVNVEVSKLSRVKILDITGKVLIERSVESGKNQINLNLKSGIYMVQIIDQKKSVYTTKLIVE